MSAASFEKSLSLVLKHEGGYVDHPADPGGATNLGVTIGTLSDWLGRKATKTEVKALTVATVAPIYRKGYWDKVRADDLPCGVDYAVFDAAVNSGPARAVKWLQAAIGVTVDGQMGPKTIAAAHSLPASVVIGRICDTRLAFLAGLSTWDTFGKGWKSRVNGVRAQALAMAAPAVPSQPPVLVAVPVVLPQSKATTSGAVVAAFTALVGALLALGAALGIDATTIRNLIP